MCFVCASGLKEQPRECMRQTRERTVCWLRGVCLSRSTGGVDVQPFHLLATAAQCRQSQGKDRQGVLGCVLYLTVACMLAL